MRGRKTTLAPGTRFGRLAVVALAPGPIRARHWRCRCDCGVETVVRGAYLRSGATRSCGCIRSESTRARALVHGGVGRPEYGVWLGLRRRCLSPADPGFKNYGGRGITVAPEWSSFARFFADMGPRPTDRHTIERLENDGPYAPWNCAWRTRREQANNMRRNHRLSCGGDNLSIAEWARRTGMRPATISSRLHLGWSVERTLSTEVR